MVILGVDPGTASTGFGVVTAVGSRLRSVAFGCIHTDAHTPLEERLAAIARAIDALIEEHAPAALAVEGVYVGGNPRSALQIGQARGAVLATAGLRGRVLRRGDQDRRLRLRSRGEVPGAADGRCGPRPAAAANP
jgi:crossover junction endodeoxyribonuclease RuvC